MCKIKAKRCMIVPVALLLIVYVASPVIAGAFAVMSRVRLSWYVFSKEAWSEWYKLSWEIAGNEGTPRIRGVQP